MRTILSTAALAATAFAAPSAGAVTVSWADLLSETTTTVGGTIATSGGPVGITLTSTVPLANDITNTDDAGPFWWNEGNPRPYTGGIVENAPTGGDIIAFSAGGTKTITFDRAVSDVYFALISWNGNAGTFDQDLEVISQGCGYWGCGSFSNITTRSFTGTGELHGIIRFTGTFNQVSFTDLNEYWHGIQIGIGGLAPMPGVPEPATWAMMIAGVGATGATLRRRRTAKVTYA